MITVEVSDLRDGRFQLLVRDTGVGIAEEDRPIIFQNSGKAERFWTEKA